MVSALKKNKLIPTPTALRNVVTLTPCKGHYDPVQNEEGPPEFL